MILKPKYKWWFYSIFGLLCIGAGLSVLGEAIIAKLNGQAWFLLGTIGLILFNGGICFVGNAIVIKVKQL